MAAILRTDSVLTKPVSHDQLRKIAKASGVPALVPHSTDPDDYRELIAPDDIEAVVRDDEIARSLQGEG